MDRTFLFRKVILSMTATVQTKKGRPNYYILIRYVDDSSGKDRQKWLTTDIPTKGNNKRKAEAKRVEVLYSNRS